MRIGEVRLRPMGSAVGRYNPTTRNITLDPAVDDDLLVANLRHELCHALDLQQDVDSADVEAWEPRSRIADTTRRDRREGFAFTCQQPTTTLGSIQSCSDTPFEQEVLRVRDWLAPDVVPDALHVDWQATVTLPEGEVVTWMSTHESGHVYGFGELDGHIWTPSGGPRPTDLEYTPPVLTVPSDRTWLTGVDTRGWQLYGDVAPSPTGFTTRASWRTITGDVLRQVLTIEDDRIVAAGCLEEDDLFFTAVDGRAWIGRQEGNTLQWGPLVRETR